MSRTARRIGRVLAAIAALSVLAFFAGGWATHQNTDFPTPEELR